ncbi:helix-turn-helix domain-containing protein [Streptomyces sp. NPDC006529]|uniref:helix-turn-helix domain-containing protein n=1 Tax=Streptomyces sp. NPDC006529 TaxID=3157177 RepID=UPI0033BC79A7
MNGRAEPSLTFAEAFGLPLSVDLRTAARAFGLCMGTAYKLVHGGGFPCAVVRVGRKFRVPTADLLRSLGIEEVPVHLSDIEAGARWAAGHRLPGGSFQLVIDC